MHDSVSYRLRKAIEESGKSMKDVAAACGIPYRTLQSYISGERKPSAHNVALISTIVQFSLDWLLTGEGEMYRQGEQRPPVDIKDIPLYNMKQWLDDYWKTAGEDEKTWLKVHFKKCFPDFDNWLLKKEQGDENAPPEASLKAG